MRMDGMGLDTACVAYERVPPALRGMEVGPPDLAYLFRAIHQGPQNGWLGPTSLVQSTVRGHRSFLVHSFHAPVL